MTASIPSRHQGFSSISGGPATPRVGGSGFTVFHWQGNPIGFAQSIGHQSPQPVAAPVPIQPLDQRYPVDIITPAAQGPGTLQLAMYELYNEKVWDRIMRHTDNSYQGGAQFNQQEIYNDLVEVFIRLAAIDPTGGGIQCTKITYPPTQAGNTARKYADTYFGCKITDIRDDENIDIGTMDITKVVTIMYTRSVRFFDTSSQPLFVN